ncbi:hypothetical protein B0H14DRAFT_1596111 [Mycena olivaceomarginata]|nr:hypothetical protein B0H14DRAFT_1596111 [Mycena olivaceomarginata]
MVRARLEATSAAPPHSMQSRMFPDCHQCLRDKVECGASIQATIAARFERPGIADEFRLNAKDLWDNGHRQVDSLSDTFPPFSMEPDSTSLDLRKNAAQICDVLKMTPYRSRLHEPATSGPKNGGANTSPGINLLGDGFPSTTTKVAWSKKELRTLLLLVPSKSTGRIEPRDVKRISLALTNKTRAQIEACYEILQKHFRIADPTQLEDHLDLYWTILHNSIAPSLGLPRVVPVKHNDVDISPESASSPLSLPGRSTSFRPEDEYSPLDLQYPPSPPIYPSSWGRESPRGRLDFNPCRNVPVLWFVKVGADASKILEVEFVFEPEFIPCLDPPQTLNLLRRLHRKTLPNPSSPSLFCVFVRQPSAPCTQVWNQPILHLREWPQPSLAWRWHGPGTAHCSLI